MNDTPTLRLLALYPEQMNIYADRGNMIFLRRRCEWRGLGFRLDAVAHGETFDSADHDLIYIGGGQDRDQLEIAGDMIRTKSEALNEAAGTGAVVLAVCGGYQLLGHSYTLAGEAVKGVGLLDIETVREDGPRLIGNIAIESSIDADDGSGPLTLAGFENHGGRTYLGNDAQPLGKVISGQGNNGKDGFEGARSANGNVIGTYLHGPLLPKNHLLADHLVALALRHRYPDLAALPPVNGDDNLEIAAHATALAAAN